MCTQAGNALSASLEHMELSQVITLYNLSLMGLLCNMLCALKIPVAHTSHLFVIIQINITFI